MNVSLLLAIHGSCSGLPCHHPIALQPLDPQNQDTWQRCVLNDQLTYITCAGPRAVAKPRRLTVNIRSVTCLQTKSTDINGYNHQK